ncbi:3-hydroxyacyl-ACP dehydratase FabZ family protein [Archangium sp.]|uniref:3-hydroxyacyl-ACP dehydratase FabZ family protein n=1 Tax=Archangium sp. TaxID=1872627 RepID=UPI00389A4C8A
MANALLPPLAVPRQSPSSISALATPTLATLWGDRLPFGGMGARFGEELPRPELYARICVRDPYFALHAVTVVGDGEVTAGVPVEQETGRECSPINAAEVGRHLAILGSCAASLVNPKEGQHYYLARRARLERLHEGPLPRAPGLLRGTAKADFKERRTATAHTLLSSEEGQPLFALEVDYNVLSAAAFMRLFQGARQDMRSEPRAGREERCTSGDFAALRQNPHREPPPLCDTVRDGECLKATLNVGAELCKGHFAMHPVLPVAVVMSALSQLAGTLLGELVGNASVRYLVKHGEVRAESLAYAGETVTFGAHLHGVEGSDHRFYCWASVGERLVGVMELTLTRVG